MPDIYVQIIMMDTFYVIITLTLLELKKKFRKWYMIPLYLIYNFAVDMGLLYQFYHPEFISEQIMFMEKAIVSSLYILVQLFLFEGGFWKVVSANIVADLFCGLPLIAYTVPVEGHPEKLSIYGLPGVSFVPWGVLIGIIIAAVFYLLVRKILYRIRDERYDKKTWVRVVTIIYEANAIIQVIRPISVGAVVGDSMLVSYGCYFTIGVLFAFLLYRQYMIKMRQEQYYLRKQNLMIQSHYESLKEQIALTHRFETDIKKAFQKIRNDFGWIGVADQTEEIPYSMYDSINQVLRIKKHKCKELSIDLHIGIPKFSLGQMEEMDIVILLYNILDNAIESCMKISDISERWIRLNIGKEDGKFIIRCENAREGQAILAKGHRTWKRDKKLHGTGMEIMRDITKKYHGEMQFEERKKEFLAKVILLIKDTRIGGEP